MVPKIIQQLKPDTYLRIIGITEKSFSKPYIIIEGEIPAEKGVFNEKEAAAKLKIISEWKKLTLIANAQSSDILGANSLVSYLFEEEVGAEKILIIMSDMRECARDFDFEDSLHIDPTMLTKAKEKGIIPSLKGVKVWVLGVHPSGKTEFYWKSLKEFWLRYFEEAEAEVVSYSMDRRWHYE